MKISLCLTAMITVLLSVDGSLTNSAVAAPTGKCVAFCSNWCARHARARDDCNTQCTLTHCN